MTDLIAGEWRNPHAPVPLPDPDGCHWCGGRRGYHGWQYILPVGGHGYEPPTDAQRLDRMKARRANTRKEN